jgi:putative peptidoglycan lipid II flippase
MNEPRKENAGGVVRASAILTTGMILGRAMGFLREALIGSRFGASATTDAYIVATTIPYILNNVVAGGSLNAALMPVLAGYQIKDQKKEVWHLCNIVLNLVIISGVILSVVIGYVLNGWCIGLVGHGFEPNTKRLAAALLRKGAFSLLLVGILDVFITVLNSFRSFWAPSLISLVLNSSIIVFVFLFSARWGITSAVLGLVCGVGAQVLLQIPSMRRHGFRYELAIDLHHPALSNLLRLFFPMMISSLLAQVYTIVDRAMASRLNPGSIAALNYASMISGVFMFVGNSIAIGSFPHLSELAARKDERGQRSVLFRSVLLCLFVLAPVCFLMAAIPIPIVGILLKRGEFDVAAVSATASALRFFAMNVPVSAAFYILSRGFFARGDTVRPLLLGFCGLAIHVCFNWVFIPICGHSGIAASTLVASLIQMYLSVVLLTLGLGGEALRFWRDALKIFGAASASAIASIAVACLMPEAKELLIAIICCGVAGSTYFGLCWILRIEEFNRVTLRLSNYVRDYISAN